MYLTYLPLYYTRERLAGRLGRAEIFTRGSEDVTITPNPLLLPFDLFFPV